MDLGAYRNIGNENIEEIVRANDIFVPRLRGYRLMKGEELLTNDDYVDIEVACCEELIESFPFWLPKSGASVWDEKVILREKYYLEKYEDFPKYGKVRWDRIHGWKRKVLKTHIHNTRKRFQKTIDAFNKYVGRDDILCIHARIGGGNWRWYCNQVQNQPWFIEKVDDPYDSTYCDIYAKLKEVPANE